ncbi:MAG: Gfo/Idh/MocA family oxidoreductase, partial [Chloroflexota bacterium]
MSREGLRLAIIGTAGIARHHVAALKALEARGLSDFVVTALCDTVAEPAEAMAQDLADSFGVRPAIYADYQQLLRDGVADAVDICLPHGLHHSFSIDAMDA